MRSPCAFARTCAVGLLVLTLLSGCLDTADPPAPAATGEDPDDQAKAPPLEPVGSGSVDAEAHEAPEGLKHKEETLAAPDFTVTTIDGETFTLSEHRDKVVVLEFMAAGCSACRANLPDQHELTAHYANESRFVFIGLDAWETEDDEALRTYREEHNITWMLAMSNNSIEKDYGFRGTPTHVFVDHEGNIHSTGRFLAGEAMINETRYLLDLIPSA